MEQSKIQWTNSTFNPWIGCSKVSPGCKNCYAEADMDNRRKRVVWGVNGTRSVTSYAYWRQPLKWDRDAAAAGIKTKVFCSSLADVFEDWEGHVVDSKNNLLWWWDENSTMPYSGTGVDVQGMPTFSHQNEKNDIFNVPLTLNAIRTYLFWLIEQTTNLYWLLLTKRPENIMQMVPDRWKDKFPENVWIGTSVENQEMANERLPILATIPAAVKFMSGEPMLEKVSLKGLRKPDWVIVGGESGSNKRPFDAEWARCIKAECKELAISFFMKQIDKVQSIPDDLMIRQFPL